MVGIIRAMSDLKKKRCCFLWAWLILYGQFAFGVEPAIRVLIFSGANSHNCKQTTPELERILKSDPNLQVAVTNHPETITADQLTECDVIVLLSRSVKWAARGTVRATPQTNAPPWLKNIKN